MNILKEITPQERRELAEAVGLGEAYLYQCLTDRANMDPAKAVKIEQLSGGRILREDLCQGNWREVWPEIAAEVAAAAEQKGE